MTLPMAPASEPDPLEKPPLPCPYDLYSLNPYDRHTNPDGIVELAIADNRLLWDLLSDRLNRSRALTFDSARYESPHGSSSLRSTIADLLSLMTLPDQTPIDPRFISITSGCEAALDVVLQTVCGVDDGVLVVTPCYPGFINNVNVRHYRLVERYIPIGQDLRLNESDLKGVKAVIISNPNAPTGRTLPRSTIAELIAVTNAIGVHLIVDEIFSVNSLSPPDSRPSSSVVPFIASSRYSHLHMVSGLSKVGLAGFKIGFICSRLPHHRLRPFTTYSQLSSDTQSLIATVFADRSFTATFLSTSRSRLRRSYELCSDLLDRHHISFLRPDAGLTLLIDLRAAIADRSEEQLADDLLTSAGLYIRPGRYFHCREPGWFRLVFADHDQVRVGVERLGRFVRGNCPIVMKGGYTRRLLRTWRRTDQIWSCLRSTNPDRFLLRPISLRHPFIFYIGHLPAFAINQIAAALGQDSVVRVNKEFDELFERGIDPDVITGSVHDHSAAINTDDWPDHRSVFEYCERVHDTILGLVDQLLRNRCWRTLDMIIEHELMHQETLLYMMIQCDVESLSPPKSITDGTTAAATAVPSPSKSWRRIPAGSASMGNDQVFEQDGIFGWDNEYPRVDWAVNAFDLESVPVSNRDYLDWIADGGYHRQENWDETGWIWRLEHRIEHPALWKYDHQRQIWLVRTLFEYVALMDIADHPVYVSYVEAAAYSRSHRCRIMTEPEYDRAVSNSTSALSPSANVDFATWSTRPSGISQTSSDSGVHDLIGNGWEWTSSVFAPLSSQADFRSLPSYPGYSADFFDGKHYVMKGGSWATDRSLLRPSFRNWYQGCYRFPFAKFRLCRDCGVGAIRSAIVDLDQITKSSAEREFADHVREGLTSRPKAISSMYLYDDIGSEIYAKITELDEYYPTRTEDAILKTNCDFLREMIEGALTRSGSVNIIELGSGDGRKTLPILGRFSYSSLPFRYYPIDRSRSALVALDASLAGDDQPPTYPITMVCGDNLAALRHIVAANPHDQRNVVLFLGSSIGNYDDAAAKLFLKAVAAVLNDDDLVIIGFDLVKDLSILVPAYSDREGVTAEFNYNILSRMNRELGANLSPDRFQHYAHYNPVEQRMESFLLAKEAHEAVLNLSSSREEPVTIAFRQHEPIHLENSYKYSLEQIEEMGSGCNLHLIAHLTDANRWFSDSCFRVRKPKSQ